MKLSLFQLDAFTDTLFGGNPAAVCPLEEWLDDGLMQAIATENNLSETAFFVGTDANTAGRYELRWFTPTCEVELCGHATLAAAHLILNRLEPSLDAVTFATRSGDLHVRRDNDRLRMDFPARPGEARPVPEELGAALGARPEEIWVAGKCLAVFADEATVAALTPNMAAVAALEYSGVIASAPGQREQGIDVVSRYFVPKYGIPEDPVTGSAHCVLVPYWAKRLGKDALRARQISARGGDLWCENLGDRVAISGSCVLYMQGEIEV